MHSQARNYTLKSNKDAAKRKKVYSWIIWILSVGRILSPFKFCLEVIQLYTDIKTTEIMMEVPGFVTLQAVQY